MKPAAFDHYAKDYDLQFTHTLIGRLQRGRVHHFFRTSISGPKKILEINCGTGEDALWLARNGHEVLATDASGEMILQAEKKKQIRRLTNLEFRQGSFLELEKLQDKKFDLVFSNFGGLNCASPAELKKLSGIFSGLLADKGKLVFVVMGRKCKWEQKYFRIKKDMERSRRRLSDSAVKTMIAGCPVETWYYSPGEMAQLFGNDFSLVKKRPVGLFIPPSYLGNYFIKRKFALSTLSLLESVFGGVGLFSDHADHYFIILEKRY